MIKKLSDYIKQGKYILLELPLYTELDIPMDIIEDSEYIRKLNSPFENECYCIDDRELVISLKSKLEQKISTYLKENNLAELEEYENCFTIKLFRCGKPNHLFTKQEIEEEMRKADDRFSNQLIIEEDGYAKVIKNEGFGYLFPVRHESWSAGNVYVGEYSTLSTL